ncbi:MAG: GspE/PulE family protein [bacterium]
MPSDERKKLGEQLLEEDVISRSELNSALEEQKRVDKRLGTILIEKGLISEEELVEFISRQTGCMVVNLENYPIKSDILNFLSKEQADRYKAVPLYRKDDVLTVAMQDPLDLVTIDDLEMITNLDVEPAIAPPSEIERFIEQAYEPSPDQEPIQQSVYLIKSSDSEQERVELEETSDQPQAVKMVNRIVREALRRNVSTIHIEPLPGKVQVLFRIFDDIKHFTDLPISMRDNLISRFEVLSSQSRGNDSEDGEILQLRYGSDKITLRMNRVGTQSGDKMVIRVRRESWYDKDLQTLGFDERSLDRLQRLIDAPRGLTLLAGPDDGGKKTTLYTILNRLSNRQMNIVTVEDPVDYELKFCSQIQVPNRSPGKKAEGVHDALRTDPDLVMVNEIGNPMVAEATLEAASSGRKVLSTYYADNAIDAMYHLTHKQGIDRFLLANSLTGVVAQRLIRIPKEDYLIEYEPSNEELSQLDLPENQRFYRVDPEPCRESKYKEFVGIYHVLPVTKLLRRCILEGASHSDFEEAATDTQLESLREKGARMVRNQVTTIDEVLRATFREDLSKDYRSNGS